MGLSNENFSTLANGEVPTYYRVIYHPDGRARIAYWWFYGWQDECNENGAFPPYVLENDGAHHGDWEHILVTTSPDRSRIEAVTYYFHSSSYTRRAGSYDVNGERPVVYVGKLGHGSYHNQDCSGWMVGTAHHCCEFADYRDPDNTYWDTHLNLIDLNGNSESWMLADREYTIYIDKGQPYAIYPWTWGPHHEYCEGLDYDFTCREWVTVSGPSTHPTVVQLDWSIPSCHGEGCGTTNCKGLVYDCDTNHNQGWPWETLSSSPANPADVNASCGEP